MQDTMAGTTQDVHVQDSRGDSSMLLRMLSWFRPSLQGFYRIEPGFSADPLGQLGRTSFFAE